jgi:hypothetical protein
MKHSRFIVGLAVLLVAVVALVGTVAAGPLFPPDKNVQAKIQDAMSAAPRSISEQATVFDWTMDNAGRFVVLRQGANGWSCFPDLPGTPGDDPQCLDANWMIWQYAWVNRTPPQLTGPGIAYMLRGGTDPSNTDPFATEPAPGASWVVTGPHIMLIEPGGLDTALFSTDPKSGLPFIMWAGTDFAHLHMPVTDQGR